MTISAYQIALSNLSIYLSSAKQKALTNGKVFARVITVIEIHTLWREAVAAVHTRLVLECIEISSRLCAPILLVPSRILFALITLAAVGVRIQAAMLRSGWWLFVAPLHLLCCQQFSAMSPVVSRIFGHGSVIITPTVAIVNG